MERNERLEIEGGLIDSVRKRFGVKIIGICANCTHAHIYRTEQMNEPLVHCSRFDDGRRMPTNIVECNKFDQVGALSIWELAKLALDVDVKTEKRAGFIPGIKDEKI